MATTPADIAAELGLAAPEDGSPRDLQWNLWIGDATALIQDAATARGVAFDTLASQKVDRAVRLMVAAASRNPDGASSVTQQVGVDDAQHSSTRRYDGAVTSGLVLTDALLDYLFGARPSSRVGSIRLGVPAWRQPRAGL